MKSTMSCRVGCALASAGAGRALVTSVPRSRTGSRLEDSPFAIFAVSSFSTPEWLHTGHDSRPAAFWPSKSSDDANQPSKRWRPGQTSSNTIMPRLYRHSPGRAASVQMRLLEEILAVAGAHPHLRHRTVAADGQRHVGPRGTEPPDAAE